MTNDETKKIPVMKFPTDAIRGASRIEPEPKLEVLIDIGGFELPPEEIQRITSDVNNLIKKDRPPQATSVNVKVYPIDENKRTIEGYELFFSGKEDFFYSRAYERGKDF